MGVTRVLVPLGGLALGLAVAGALYVRAAPMVPSEWHADPLAAERTGRPNDALHAPGGDAAPWTYGGAPAEALAALDRVARADGAEVLAGAPEEGRMTWVQRSGLMGYPDAITARAEPSGNGAVISVWSRSRFGYDDLGVNADRLSRWRAALDG